MVGIAASTGGPAALATLLRALPPLLAPVLVVQHIHPSFTAGFVTWLDAEVPAPVQCATDGALPLPGHVYVAPAEVHLRLGAAGRMSLDPDPPAVHRPSADELFHSIAERAGPAAVGVSLTGMGQDGARGLLAMRRAGARTFAQDEASSVVFGMPRAALRVGRGAAAHAAGADRRRGGERRTGVRVTRSAAAGPVDRAAELLAGRIGLRVEGSMRSRVRRAIRDGAAARGESPAAYVAALLADEAAVEALVDAITVQESGFFRDAGHFEVLVRRALPALPGAGVVWSAGCGNGQEAWSLAIALEEAGAADWRVLATDVVGRGAQPRGGRPLRGAGDRRPVAGAARRLPRADGRRHVGGRRHGCALA